jgi:hypothetical protein
MTRYSLVSGYEHFEGTFCRPHFALKMEAAGFNEINNHLWNDTVTTQKNTNKNYRISCFPPVL